MFPPYFVAALTLALVWRPIAALPADGKAVEVRSNDASASQPIPPKQDPWYTAPAGYESAAPGTILRLRPAPGNLTTVISNCSAAYNVLFRTTNSAADPAFAVTTVFLPSAVDASHSAPLLSYQIPYNTADLNGSPSYFLYTLADQYADIPWALGQGYVVSVPDFEGPLASFLLGLTEGHAVLDAIRSVLAHSPFGVSSNASKTALWGYSGGSIASMNALELQAQYAPELTIQGAAIGGTVPNFFTTASIVDAGPQAGLLAGALLGLTSQSSAARELLTSSLNPNNASQFMRAENLTLIPATVAFNLTDVSSYFRDYAGFLFSPEIQAIQKDNWYLGYRGVPQMPVFMYKAIKDELAPVNDVDDLVERWCSLGGVDIRYERNRVGGHASEYENGVPRARQFLSSVFDGSNSVVPIHGGCVTVDVSIGPDVSPI